MVLSVVRIDAEANVVSLEQGSTIRDDYLQAIREGRAFSVGTGTVTVNTGMYLNQIFENPVGSGKNAFVVKRIFNTDRLPNFKPIDVEFLPSPDALPAPIVATPANLKTGGMSSAMRFHWSRSEAPLTKTPPLSQLISFFVPGGGKGYIIDTLRIVEPGESFGFLMNGGAEDADKVTISYTWYEEDAS